MNTNSVKEILKKEASFNKLAYDSFSCVDKQIKAEKLTLRNLLLFWPHMSMTNETPNRNGIKEIMDLDLNNSWKISFKNLNIYFNLHACWGLNWIIFVNKIFV